MSDLKPGIALNTLAVLSQMSVDELKAIVDAKMPDFQGFTIGDFVLDGPYPPGAFPVSAALKIEVARQLSDNSGLPLLESLRIVSYTGAVDHYDRYDCKSALNDKAADLWMAIVGARNTWGGDEPRRGSIEVTNFGPTEFWSTAHYKGSFAFVTDSILERMTRESLDYPDADVARVFMANVSAADRRLRKRAAEFGIEIGG